MISCCTASTKAGDDVHHTFDQRKTDTFCMLLLLLMYNYYRKFEWFYYISNCVKINSFYMSYVSCFMMKRD